MKVYKLSKRQHSTEKLNCTFAVIVNSHKSHFTQPSTVHQSILAWIQPQVKTTSFKRLDIACLCFCNVCCVVSSGFCFLCSIAIFSWCGKEDSSMWSCSKCVSRRLASPPYCNQLQTADGNPCTNRLSGGNTLRFCSAQSHTSVKYPLFCPPSVHMIMFVLWRQSWNKVLRHQTHPQQMKNIWKKSGCFLVSWALLMFHDSQVWREKTERKTSNQKSHTILKCFPCWSGFCDLSPTLLVPPGYICSPLSYEGLYPGHLLGKCWDSSKDSLCLQDSSVPAVALGWCWNVWEVLRGSLRAALTPGRCIMDQKWIRPHATNVAVSWGYFSDIPCLTLLDRAQLHQILWSYLIDRYGRVHGYVCIKHGWSLTWNKTFWLKW